MIRKMGCTPIFFLYMGEIERIDRFDKW